MWAARESDTRRECCHLYQTGACALGPRPQPALCRWAKRQVGSWRRFPNGIPCRERFESRKRPRRRKSSLRALEQYSWTPPTGVLARSLTTYIGRMETTRTLTCRRSALGASVRRVECRQPSLLQVRPDRLASVLRLGESSPR